MSYKTYFISGGGTGGHIYPAFTIAERLLKEEDTKKICFFGNPKNLEYKIAQKYPQIEFLPVETSGMPRKLSLKMPLWAVQFFCAYLKAIFYIKKYKPDVVFTTGGYVCAPLNAAAATLKIPFMIHDCDSVPGLVSKFSAPFAKTVSVAFETSKSILKSKNIICNGNPLREEFFTVTKEEARKKLNIPDNKTVIFAMGGSQGAQTINNAASDIIKTLSGELNIYFILQTGINKFNETLEKLEKVYPEYKCSSNIMIRPYFDEMAYPLKASDLVIARAGSLSLSEIIYCSLVSILIPYPYAAQDHQRKNAKELCDKGMALYLEDNECTGENLLSKINEIIKDETKFSSMREIIKASSRINPAEQMVKQLKNCLA